MFPQGKIKELGLIQRDEENKTQIVNPVDCLKRNSQNYNSKSPLGDVNASINLIKKGNLGAKLQDRTTEKKIDHKIISQKILQKNVQHIRKNTSDLKLKSLELISQEDQTWKKVSTRNTNTNLSFSPLESSFSKSNKLKKLKMSSSEKEALFLLTFSKKSSIDCTETSGIPEITNKNITVRDDAALDQNSVDHESVSPWSTKRKVPFISPILTGHSKKIKSHQCVMLKENKDKEDESLCASGNSHLSPVLGGFQYLTNYKENKDKEDESLCASGNSHLSPVLGGFQYLTNYKDDCEEILSPVLGSSANPLKNKLKGGNIRSSRPAVNYNFQPSQEPSSPVLDSSQYIKRFSFDKQHLSTTVAIVELPQQQSVIESLSPVLDSSQFRKIDLKNKDNYFLNKDKLKTVTSSEESVCLGLSNKKLSLRLKKVKHRVHTPLKTRKCCTGEQQNSPFQGDQTKTEVLNLPHDFYLNSQGSSIALSPTLDSSQFKNNFLGNSQNKEVSLKELCNKKDPILSPSQQVTKSTDNVEPISPVLDSSQYMKTFVVKSSKRKKNYKNILTQTNFKNVGLSILSPRLTTMQPLSTVLDSNQFKCRLPIVVEMRESKTEELNCPVPPITVNEESTASCTLFSSPVHECSQSSAVFSMNPEERTKKGNVLLMSRQPQNRMESSSQVFDFNKQNKEALDGFESPESEILDQVLILQNSSIKNNEEAVSPVLDSCQFKINISTLNDEPCSKTPEKNVIELKDGDQSLSPILDSSQDYKKFLVKLTEDKKNTEPQTLTKDYQSFLLQLSKNSQILKNCEKTDRESSKMFALEHVELSPTKLPLKSPCDDNLTSPSKALYSSDKITFPFLSTKHIGEEEMGFSVDHQLIGTSQSLALPYSGRRLYMEEYLEPMLGTVFKSNKYLEDSLYETPMLVNKLDYTELNSDSKDMKRKYPLPSCNSELDIIQFPLLLSQSGDLSSSLQGYVSNPGLLSGSKNKQGSPGFIAKNKEFSIENSKEDCTCSETNHLSPLCNSNNMCHDPCNDSNSNSTKNQEEQNGNSRTILQKGPENSTGGSRKRPTSKKTVKKRLTLLYKDDNNLQTNSLDHDEKTAKNEENGEDTLSGVEQLPETSVCDEDIPLEKLKKPVINEKGITGRQNDLSHIENQSTNKSFRDQCSNKQNERGTWRIPVESFEVHQEVYIEDFDEESPYNQNNSEITEVDKINGIKRNLIHSLDISEPSTKSNVPDRTNLLSVVADGKNDEVNYETEVQDTNGYLTKPCAEAEIQEDLTQDTVTSQPFQIECSTSPTTKSSEGTQYEGGSGTISFPPPLNIPTSKNPTPTDLLDSACKIRRARVKKGSLLDRLRRVVRAERAEVNMFHHEGPSRLATAACTLQVLSVTTACTNLLLHATRLNTASTINPDELSGGEEVVDSEVRVFIDPLYAKQVTPGSTVLVYPPWQSDWREGRGLVMFGVSRVRVIGSVDTPLLPLPAPHTTRHGSVLLPSVLHKFQCQEQDEVCGCRQQLVSQLFGGVEQSTRGAGPATGSVKAALITGKLPGHCTLTLTPLHRFHFRNRNKQVVAGLLCVDSNNDVCQVNLSTSEDEKKVADLLANFVHQTLMFKKMGLCKRVFIDRYEGLRSVVSQLWPESISQSLMYVVSPASDEWLVKSTCSATDYRPASLATLSETEDLTDARVQTRVQVMALRGEQLIVWDKTSDRYFRISVSPTAVLPAFTARDCLQLTHLWAFNGELFIDKFTCVSVVQTTSEDVPSAVPPLSVDSAAGDLVLLDSVVTRVQSDACVRWTGTCGHELLRVHQTQLFYCAVCSQTSSHCRQRLLLEVCVAANSVPTPVRLKVKSETAQVLLLGSPGQVSSDKCYNAICAIGTSLKCLALVLEVLKNPFGDVLEFLLEEL